MCAQVSWLLLLAGLLSVCAQDLHEERSGVKRTRVSANLEKYDGQGERQGGVKNGWCDFECEPSSSLSGDQYPEALTDASLTSSVWYMASRSTQWFDQCWVLRSVKGVKLRVLYMFCPSVESQNDPETCYKCGRFKCVHHTHITAAGTAFTLYLLLL